MYITRFLPLALIISLLSGLIFVVAQQEIRLSANDRPVELATDAAAALKNDQSPASLVSQKRDLSVTLSPFLIIYTADGQPALSSVILDGKTPPLPSGVFDYVRMHGEDRITWQPKNGVRVAAVILPYQSGNTTGFVLGGQSLREAEKREDLVLLQVFSGWLVTMVIVFLSQLFFDRQRKKK